MKANLLQHFSQGVYELQVPGALKASEGSDATCNDDPVEVFDFVFLTLGVCVYLGLPYILQETLPSRSLPAAGTTSCWPRSLPALNSLRYIAVLIIWFQHNHWGWIHVTSEFFLMLSGFLLQLAEHRRGKTDENLFDMYSRFLPKRIWKLYPLYALHVFIGYLLYGEKGSLKHFPEETRCDPVQALLLYQSWGFGTGACQQTATGHWHKLYHYCGTGTWFISVIIGCYILFPLVSRPLKGLRLKPALAVWMACAFCLVVSPRALEVDLRFTRKSILLGFAHFFLGMTSVIIWEYCQDWHDLSKAREVTDAENKEDEGSGDCRDGKNMASFLLTYGCSLGFVVLCIRKAIETQKGGVRMNFLQASASEILEVVDQTWFLIGSAGPVKSQHFMQRPLLEKSTTESASLAESDAQDGLPRDKDPLRRFLSWAPLAGMSELALPMYMLSTFTSLFADRLLHQNGLPAKNDGGGHIWQAEWWCTHKPFYFLAEVICIHIVAIIVSRSCKGGD